LLFQFTALLPRTDFVSVGSNDLIQFLFASDRGNPKLARRYDPLSPLVLSFLREVIERCSAAQIPVSLCGEMASNPLEAMALIGLGFREISVSLHAVGSVKRMVRSLSVKPLADYMESLYDMPEHSVRGKLKAFALDHGVVI
jgi:phosphotransferase system enzyme I (PtsP)